ncbi:Pseudouridine synthase, catalytic domain [Pseudocohnilembus persalinus]|uniref:Pseudouridine synthase, catalytic domain n=1 Tax=Pseudocohnilembus persalinus TaxID=266149 RepID=A0A0V0QZ89_PSEPJ|nr:Pseudouridine synthase, catalytic domain [Pseudocohnilembus persalinus]|eukprot:KRX07205.1 Pseudouridine synthase, catalytic domain [Pseudocohnilembus persalinus]
MQQTSQIENKLNFSFDPDEISCGITEYLNYLEPIRGMVKYRISDFIVNEIDLKTKKVVFFQKNTYNQKIEEYNDAKKNGFKKKKGRNHEPSLLAQQKLEKEQGEQIQNIEKKIQPEDEKEFIELFGQEKFEEVKKFYEDWESGEKKSFYEFTIDKPEEKQKRTQIHEFVREKLPYFDSNTDMYGIKISFTKNCAKKAKYLSAKEQKLEKQFTFTLFKHNIDTFQALGFLASFLKQPVRNFSTAGLKDKRGYTTQKISINSQKQTLQSFISKIEGHKSNQIFTSDYEVAENLVRIGDLYGNRFTIALRLIDSLNQEKIAKCISGLKEDGFINYYGMQRFGSGQVKTWQTGKLVLQGNWSQAASDLLYENGPKFKDILYEYKETNDSDKALRYLPKSLKLERDMIKFYQTHGTNSHQRCLLNLPKSMKDLWLHAYQSYIWNKTASLRIKKYGKKVVIGDLVAKKQSQNENKDQQLNQGQEKNNDIQEQQQDTDNLPDIQGDVDEDEIEYKGVNQVDYEYVNEQNIDQYKLSDVLIPIIGNDLKINLEEYYLGQEILDLLQQDNITMKNFEECQKNFYVTGGLRRLTFNIEDVEYKIIRFNDKDADFLTPFYNEEEDINIENGKYAALVLRFTLQKGCYATMMFRELTKMSSSYSYQQILNQQYKELNSEENEQKRQNQQNQENVEKFMVNIKTKLKQSQNIEEEKQQNE